MESRLEDISEAEISSDAHILENVLQQMPNNPDNQRSFLQRELENNPQFNGLMRSPFRLALAEGYLGRELPNLITRSPTTQNNINGGKRTKRKTKSKRHTYKRRTCKRRKTIKQKFYNKK